MPNWDADDEYDYQSTKRKNVMRTPEQRIRKTWNGNPVSQMDSDHIMNAILYCERKFSEAVANHTRCHGVVEEFYFRDVFDMFPEYINLRDEWSSRMEKK